MGICGHAGHSLASVERSLSALHTAAGRRHSRVAAASADFGVCDHSSLAAAHGRVALFDGRLDNGADLIRELGIAEAGHLPPADLLLLAYEKWGDDFCSHVLGDFACAVWDGRQRRLVLTTDPGALRTLFFWQNKKQILFASEQRGLFAHPDVPREPDRQQIATWLSMLPREPLRTFFRDICRVPPGHRVIWNGSGIRLERWWQPEALPTLRLKSDADYEDAVRETLKEAVRCRILPDDRIGAQLSGGLDSSSVVSLAAEQLGKDNRRLTAFTAAARHRTEQLPGRFADEWPYAALVAERHRNIDHVRIDNDDMPVPEALDWLQSGNDWPLLNSANTVWVTGICKAAHARRLNTMLIASMGNLTVSYTGQELLAERLQHGDLIGAARTMRGMRREGGWSYAGIASQIARAFLPHRTVRSLRYLLGKRDMTLPDFSAIRPEFLRQSGLEERAHALSSDLSNLGSGDGRKLRMTALDRTDHRGHTATGIRRLFGLDVRDPTSDRRLMDLCLSIPEEQFAKDGVPRSLFRRTMRGIVPDPLLDERRKGKQAADWRIGFDAAIPTLRAEVARLRNSALASECLDLDRLEKLLDDWPGPDDHAATPELAYQCAFARAYNVGRFIQRIEGGNG